MACDLQGKLGRRSTPTSLAASALRKKKATPTTFFNKATEVRCVVHGDDFTFLGFEDYSKDVAEAMKGWHDLKIRGVLGGEDGDDEEVTNLSRTLSWRGHNYL